jgi:hypothetical protein
MDTITYDCITISDMSYKPTRECNPVTIYGRVYMGRINSPNIYVVKTDNTIRDHSSVMFNNDGLQYQLKDVMVTKLDDGNSLIECRSWKEIVINP